MDFLKYIRLKVFVSFIRLLSRAVIGSTKASPDSVLQIPSRDSSRTIKAHIYRPPTDARPTGPSPVLINFHGSGFILPMHGSDDEFCRLMANKTSHTVFDIQYRLSPENPFPAPIEDAEDVVRWILARPTDYDSAKVSVSGFSAGGNIALAIAGAVMPRGTFRCAIAIYPVVDVSISVYDKKPPDTGGRAMPPFLMNLFNESYIPNGQDLKDPRLSPRFADKERFPDRMLIVTCAYDNLALEAEALAKEVEEVEGKKVICRRLEKVEHAWDKGDWAENSEKDRHKWQAKQDAYKLAAEMLTS